MNIFHSRYVDKNFMFESESLKTNIIHSRYVGKNFIFESDSLKTFERKTLTLPGSLPLQGPTLGERAHKQFCRAHLREACQTMGERIEQVKFGLVWLQIDLDKYNERKRARKQFSLRVCV